MNIWLHRISHHVEIARPLLDKGILTIGFSDLCKADFIEKVYTQGITAIDQACKDSNWSSLPKSRYSLLRFLTEMQKGDWILVPESKVFSIYEITGEKAQLISSLDVNNFNIDSLHLENGEIIYGNSKTVIDLGFYWKVKILEENGQKLLNIPRATYPDSFLVARMKILSTNAKISDLESSVKDTINKFINNKPINIHDQITESTIPTIVKTLHKYLNPDNLEKLISWYFSKIGANDVIIPPRNEKNKVGDIDVIATFDSLRVTVYVQAKFHRGETSEYAVKQINDYASSKNFLGGSIIDGYSRIFWVISTAETFSERSIEEAQELGFQLIDGKGFAAMLIEAGLSGLDKIFN